MNLHPVHLNIPTARFLWRNGTLLQEFLILEGGTDWQPVLVDGKQVKDPHFRTFEQRAIQMNGKPPTAKRDGWDHVIEFDGGTSRNVPPNYGNGYGSYQIDGGAIQRVTFGKGHSNNSAEVRTLVAGLQALYEAGNVGRILCRGDSQIALNWITCRGKPKKKGSQGFLDAVDLLQAVVVKFTKVKGEWRRRDHSVKLFGH